MIAARISPVLDLVQAGLEPLHVDRILDVIVKHPGTPLLVRAALEAAPIPDSLRADLWLLRFPAAPIPTVPHVCRTLPNRAAVEVFRHVVTAYQSFRELGVREQTVATSHYIFDVEGILRTAVPLPFETIRDMLLRPEPRRQYRQPNLTYVVAAGRAFAFSGLWPALGG